MSVTGLRNRSTAWLARRLLGAIAVASVTGSIAVLPAHASDVDPLGLAERTAEEFWGNVPCGGQIAISWQSTTPPPAMPGTEVEAWVGFETPDGQLDFAAAPSTYTACVVYISSVQWPTYSATVDAYPQFCQMMVHEFGHFEGYADSRSYAPSDIRYPLLTDANIPPSCLRDVSAQQVRASQPATPPSRLKVRARAGYLNAKERCFEVGCQISRHRKKQPGS